MNIFKKISAVTVFFLGAGLISCGNSSKASSKTTIEDNEEAFINPPTFSADSAYLYIQSQVNFGPRVPNTQAHRDCGTYLAAELERFGAKVYNQYADLVAYDGTILKAR